MYLKGIIICLCLSLGNYVRTNQEHDSNNGIYSAGRLENEENIVVKRSAETEENATAASNVEEEDDVIPDAANRALLPSRQLQPTIRLSLSQFQGEAGDRIKVKCYGNSPFLSWSNPKLHNITTVTVGSPRVFLDKRQNTSDLIFDPIAKGQEGVYKCENKISAQAITSDFRLTIKEFRPVTPPIPTINLDSRQYDGVVGAQFSVTCFGNSPNLTWTGPNNQNLSSVRINSITITLDRAKNTSRLSFNPLQLNHAGNYICINNIQGRSTDFPFRLVVNSYPTVKLLKKKHEGLIGSSTSVVCSGNSPNLTWTDKYNRNLYLNPVQFIRVINKGNNSELYFDQISKDQGGTYTCTNTIATNKAYENFELVPTAPQVLRPSVKLSNYKQDGLIGTSISVVCFGNSPNLIWSDKYSRDLSSMIVPFVRVLRNPVQNTSELIFDRVDKDQGGTYTCTNTIGATTEYARFELVPYVPKPTVSLNVGSRVEKYPSQTFRVMCTGNSNSITWKSPTNTIIFQRTTGSLQDLYTTGGGQNLELVFDDIRREHRGRYTCSVSLNDMVEYKYFELNVEDLPKLELTPSSDSVVLEARSSYKVECKNRKVSGIQWFGPNNQPIIGSSGGVEVKTLLYGMELKIARASPRLSGFYECAGNVDGIPVRRSLVVSVTKRQRLSDPVFVSFEYDIMRKKVGEAFSITCEGETSQLNWKRAVDFEPITNDTFNRIFSSDVIRVDDDTYTKKLEGRTLQLDDGGVYLCQVADGFEIRNRSLTLMITDPVSFTPGVSSYYEIVEGLNVTLECAARGYPPPNIEWYRQSGSSTKSISGEGYTKLADKLIIVNVTRAHAGTYTCYAKQESIDGTYGERSLALKVNHKPVFVHGNITLYNYVGRTVNLTCGNVLSEPPAGYRWTKDGAHLSSSKTVTVPFKNVNDFGVYTCEATNIFGTATRNITVVQSEKPNAPEFKVHSVVQTKVHFRIKNDQKSVTHYVIQYAMVPGGTFSKNYTFAKENGTGTTGTLSMVYRRTKYVLRAASINNVEQSEFSKNVTITTGSSISIRPPSLTMQLVLLSFTFAISYPLFGH